MEEDLKGYKFKPCPFCGCNEIEVCRTIPYWCACTGCYAEAPSARTIKQAVAIWNKRVLGRPRK